MCLRNKPTLTTKPHRVTTLHDIVYASHKGGESVDKVMHDVDSNFVLKTDHDSGIFLATTGDLLDNAMGVSLEALSGQKSSATSEAASRSGGHPKTSWAEPQNGEDTKTSVVQLQKEGHKKTSRAEWRNEGLTKTLGAEWQNEGHTKTSGAELQDEGHTKTSRVEWQNEGYTKTSRVEWQSEGYTKKSGAERQNGGHTKTSLADLQNEGHTKTSLAELQNEEHTKTLLAKLQNEEHTKTSLVKLQNNRHTKTSLAKLQNEGHTKTSQAKLKNEGHTKTSLAKLQNEGHINTSLAELQIEGHSNTSLAKLQNEGHTKMSLAELQNEGHTKTSLAELQISDKGQSEVRSVTFSATADVHCVSSRSNRRRLQAESSETRSQHYHSVDIIHKQTQEDGLSPVSTAISAPISDTNTRLLNPDVTLEYDKLRRRPGPTVASLHSYNHIPVAGTNQKNVGKINQGIPGLKSDRDFVSTKINSVSLSTKESAGKPSRKSHHGNFSEKKHQDTLDTTELNRSHVSEKSQISVQGGSCFASHAESPPFTKMLDNITITDSPVPPVPPAPKTEKDTGSESEWHDRVLTTQILIFKGHYSVPRLDDAHVTSDVTEDQATPPCSVVTTV